MMHGFVHTLSHYIVEVAPSLAFGFLLSGVIREFVPQDLVNRYLARRGVSSLLYVTVAGILLPLCCFGSLPVAGGLRKKGGPLGPVLAFLVATPATSVTALLVTWRLMGTSFTIAMCVTVVAVGVIVGLVGNLMSGEGVTTNSGECPVCAAASREEQGGKSPAIGRRVKAALSYGFIELPREIGFELMVGLLLAAAVGSIGALGEFVNDHLVGGVGYVFATGFGLLMYICSTASVPLVHAFVANGLSVGAGMVLLLVGPITSYGTLLVVRKEFGGKVLGVYIALICLLSVAAGKIYEIVLRFL
jgi:uncharacterized membrane protein YraQ (UPF0718 family)